MWLGGEDGASGQLLAHFIEQQDQAAVTALVQRHVLMVWGVCRRILRERMAQGVNLATVRAYTPMGAAEGIVPATTPPGKK